MLLCVHVNCAFYSHCTVSAQSVLINLLNTCIGVIISCFKNTCTYMTTYYYINTYCLVNFTIKKENLL